MHPPQHVAETLMKQITIFTFLPGLKAYDKIVVHEALKSYQTELTNRREYLTTKAHGEKCKYCVQ